MNKSSSTGEAIVASQIFAVNVLAEDHAPLATRFASRVPDKFDGVAVERATNGAPLLVGAIAHLVCRVHETVEAATHHVFLASVVEAVAYPGHPLAYFRGAFGRMQTAPDAAVLRSVRDFVIASVSDVSEPIDAQELATRLGVEVGLVSHALTALVSESLVRREAGTYVLEPIPEAVLYEYYAAKLAIEIGVAQQTVGRVTADQVGELRSLAEATGEFMSPAGFTDASAWVEANHAFHEYFVGLAGSRVLLDTYHRLGLPGLERRTITSSTYATPELLEDHLALAESFERADLPGVIHVLQRHAERPRQLRALDPSRSS